MKKGREWERTAHARRNASMKRERKEKEQKSYLLWGECLSSIPRRERRSECQGSAAPPLTRTTLLPLSFPENGEILNGHRILLVSTCAHLEFFLKMSRVGTGGTRSYNIIINFSSRFTVVLWCSG